MQVFEEEGALHHFEGFASLNGPNFHGIPVNEGTIELVRRPGRMPAAVSVEGTEVVVYRGGEDLPWSIGRVSA